MHDQIPRYIQELMAAVATAALHGHLVATLAGGRKLHGRADEGAQLVSRVSAVAG